MKITENRTRNRCLIPSIFAGLALLPTVSSAADLVSHWEMNNPPATSGTYLNSVGGSPSMVWDAATKAPATFDPNETRLETSFDATKSTHFAASGSSLNLNTFSFSMIVDPTDMIDFGSILTKETSYGAGAVYENIGWQLQHNSAGDIEFVVRGNAGGFFGAISVPGSASGLTAGGSFGDPATYFQIAGGYDSGSGSAFLYVTPLGMGTLGTFTPHWQPDWWHGIFQWRCRLRQRGALNGHQDDAGRI